MILPWINFIAGWAVVGLCIYDINFRGFSNLIIDIGIAAMNFMSAKPVFEWIWGIFRK